jgi:hypothetical protein
MRPFRIDVPQADLDDLLRRVRDARWPSQVPGVGWDRGVPVDHVRDLVERWTTTYDWRAVEAQVNRYPQFTTDIDGQTSTSCTYARRTSARCRSCSPTAGPARSSSSSRSSSR